jgi:hypothetical protein
MSPPLIRDVVLLDERWRHCLVDKVSDTTQLVTIVLKEMSGCSCKSS